MTSAAAQGAQHEHSTARSQARTNTTRTGAGPINTATSRDLLFCTPELGEICTQVSVDAELGGLEIELVTSDRVCTALLRERLMLSKMFMSNLERGREVRKSGDGLK